jgi:hypothetical protein
MSVSRIILLYSATSLPLSLRFGGCRNDIVTGALGWVSTPALHAARQRGASVGHSIKSPSQRHADGAAGVAARATVRYGGGIAPVLWADAVTFRAG